jgi:hypothetical protein
MKIICHRINKIEDLKKIPKKFGVEVDVRSYGEKLLLSHEPINNHENYDELKEYLDIFNHAFIIFNIKEAGIEKEVINLAEGHKIENYFLLDVEFPFIYKSTRENGFRKIAIRFSEAEPIEMALAQKGMLDWVWVDTNTKIPLDKKAYSKLKRFNICLVCPSRWGRPKDIDKYIDYIIQQGMIIDAVMTSLDFSEKWERLNGT